MRKVILDLAVSLDGFIEGPNGEIDWCIMDEDMQFDRFLDKVDTIFYGRVSYDAWGQFRPDTAAPEAEQQFWAAIHSKQKVVFSRQDRSDPAATFISGHIPERVAELRQLAGKDIWLYGGAGLIRTFIAAGLVDEYRLSVHPVVLGGGKPVFEQLQDRLSLQLSAVNRFRSGVVQLIYRPANS